MAMWIGAVTVSIRLYSAESLKDRRQVVRSLLERAKRHFNASVTDLGPDGVWNRADLGVVFGGSSSQEMEQRLDKFVSFLEHGEEDGEFEMLSIRREVFSYGDI